MEAEANKGVKADQIRVDMLRNQLRLAADNAMRLSSSGEYRRILEENGATEVTALASAASTEYSYNLPSNRAELWFLMESQRLMHPIFRDFYRERDVVLEEYRQRVECNPQAKLMAEVLAAAFKAHPYRNPARWLAQRYCKSAPYRGAGILRALLCSRQHHGGDRRGCHGGGSEAAGRAILRPDAGQTDAALVTTEEPPQTGPKTVVVEMTGPPAAVVGYKRPSQYDKDDIALDLIQILFPRGGRACFTANWFGRSVSRNRPRRLRRTRTADIPTCSSFCWCPRRVDTVEENQRALEELLRRFKTTPLDPQLLARAKAQGRANLIRRMTNNGELAALLALHAANYGDWRKLFTQLDELDQVKAEDVLRAASRYLVATGRTTVYTVPPGQSGAAAAPERRDRRRAMRTLAGVFLLAAARHLRRMQALRDAKSGGAALRRRCRTRPAQLRRRTLPPAALISPKDLKFPPLRTIQEPAAASFTLPNGMRIYLLEDHDLPLVSGVALVRTGSLLDPPQRIGLAQLAGIAMRTGGTNVKTGEQVDTLLDEYAATMEFAIGDSHGHGCRSRALKENAAGHPPTVQGDADAAGFPPGQDRDSPKSQLRASSLAAQRRCQRP